MKESFSECGQNDTDHMIVMHRLHDPLDPPSKFMPIPRIYEKLGMIQGCVLCSPIFYERNTIFSSSTAFTWHSPDFTYTPAHTMITLNRHQDTYESLSADEFEELRETMETIKKSYLSSPKIREVIFFQALGGKVAGQGVEGHFHIHGYPRFISTTDTRVNYLSNTRFINFDASSYVLKSIMKHHDPEFMNYFDDSDSIPGGITLSAKMTPALLLQTIRKLEQFFYDCMDSLIETMKGLSPEEKIAVLTQASNINSSVRRDRIFQWMIHAFSQNDHHLFGINILYTDRNITFLPRSGLFTCGRKGPVSIFENMHFSAEKDNNHPNSHTSDPKTYSPAYQELQNTIFKSLRNREIAYCLP